MALLLTAVLGVAPTALEVAGAHSSTIRDVRYVGADHLSSRELRDLTGVHPGDSMDPRRNERGRQAILKKYQEDGRYYASVELVEGAKPTDSRVAYSIVEGPVVKVAAVEFAGNQCVASARLKAQLVTKCCSSLQVGGKFNPTSLELDRKALLEYYCSLGFRGTVITSEVKRSADMSRVTVAYHIIESPR